MNALTTLSQEARRPLRGVAIRSRGPVHAVIFDWAGTTVDFGCMAPVECFLEVFRRRGVPITLAEARGPMGTHKRTHIQRITEMPAVAARWLAEVGGPPTDADVDAMFAEFVPLQLACLANNAEPIPGCLDTVARLRARGIKIGSTTGFTREMMDVLLPETARRGYAPDTIVAATDVPAGRPYPFMCLKNVIDLQISSVEGCVKVDDTLAGIQEGLNAGMWTVGVAMTGNEVGMPEAALAALTPTARAELRATAYRRMLGAGAHYVIDGISDLLPVIDAIESRMSCGERP